MYSICESLDQHALIQSSNRVGEYLVRINCRADCACWSNWCGVIYKVNPDICRLWSTSAYYQSNQAVCWSLFTSTCRSYVCILTKLLEVSIMERLYSLRVTGVQEIVSNIPHLHYSPHHLCSENLGRLTDVDATSLTHWRQSTSSQRCSSAGPGLYSRRNCYGIQLSSFHRKWHYNMCKSPRQWAVCASDQFLFE